MLLIVLKHYIILTYIPILLKKIVLCLPYYVYRTFNTLITFQYYISLYLLKNFSSINVELNIYSIYNYIEGKTNNRINPYYISA